jgi:Tetratricopeptide repeat.
MKSPLLPRALRVLLPLCVCFALGQGALAAGNDKEFSQLLKDGMNAIRQNQLQSAEPLLEKSLKEAEKFGPNDRRVGESLVNLGVVYAQKKDWPKAIAVSKRALNIDIKVHGENHPDVAYDYHQLGTYLDISGKHAEATPYLKKALSMRDNLPGLSPTLVGVTAENLGENLSSLKRTVDAEALYRQSLKYFKDDKNPECYFRRVKAMGEIYRDPKRAIDGKNFYKAELTNLDHLFGSDSPWSATLLNQQGQFAMQTKDYVLAESTFRRLTSMSKLPGGTPNKAAAQNGLAVALFKQGKCKEAAPCFQKAISILEGANMPKEARTLKLNYADCLQKLGKPKKPPNCGSRNSEASDQSRTLRVTSS